VVTNPVRSFAAGTLIEAQPRLHPQTLTIRQLDMSDGVDALALLGALTVFAPGGGSLGNDSDELGADVFSLGASAAFCGAPLAHARTTTGSTPSSL